MNPLLTAPAASPATSPAARPPFTYGLELEWTDWDRSIPIPPELAILTEDEITVCNRDGSPYGKGPEGRGGELCVTPSDSIEEAVEKVARLREIVGSPALSHRCHLHAHIAFPGLRDDVSAQLALFRYSIAPANADALERLAADRPEIPEIDDDEARKAAAAWLRRSDLYTRSRVPSSRIPEILAATTPREFYDAHFAPRRDGRGRAYGVAPRYTLNLRSIHKHGTVEFRMFSGTTEPDEVRELLSFAERYVEEALSPEPTPVAEYVDLYSAPPSIPFDLDAEIAFVRARMLEDVL